MTNINHDPTIKSDLNVGDVILTNFDGYKYWYPARISEIVDNLFLITSFSGTQKYVSAENIRKLEVWLSILILAAMPIHQDLHTK